MASDLSDFEVVTYHNYDSYGRDLMYFIPEIYQSVPGVCSFACLHLLRLVEYRLDRQRGNPAAIKNSECLARTLGPFSWMLWRDLLS